jgi:hypothetical protein
LDTRRIAVSKENRLDHKPLNDFTDRTSRPGRGVVRFRVPFHRLVA